MRDALHKATRRLADEFEILVFEDLNLPGMTKSAKGTMEEPGRNVRAKSGLNRELLAACLGKIPVMAALKEARVVVVDPRNTSRLCPECGSTDAANRSSTRFLCISCGYEADADVNAARNIRERWSTQSGSADRSQSACARETGKMRDDFLVPAEWGRSVARKRLSFHRSSAG
jgi:transposase